MNKRIQIMDTSLRDGEQTTGVSFTSSEKLSVTQLLLKEVKVDRVEVASARVSNGEFDAVKRITAWAKLEGLLDRIEILGFVDGTKSVDWIVNAGAQVINLLCKGSLKHVQGQLRKTPEEHTNDIKELVKYANNQGLSVNIYLEDWSNGMRNYKDYVFYMLDELTEENIIRFMLADTLGVLNPTETYEYLSEIIKKYPDLNFDFHAHNDYDLAVANVVEAIKAGVDCVHTTVNGLGERTDSLVETVITWRLHREFKTRGLETDQTSAAIVATEKMLNIIENENN